MNKGLKELISNYIVKYGYEKGYININKLIVSGVIDLDSVVNLVIAKKEAVDIQYAIMYLKDAPLEKLVAALLKTGSSHNVEKVIEYIIENKLDDEIDLKQLVYDFGKLGLDLLSPVRSMLFNLEKYEDKKHLIIEMINGISYWYMYSGFKDNHIQGNTKQMCSLIRNLNVQGMKNQAYVSESIEILVNVCLYKFSRLKSTSYNQVAINIFVNDMCSMSDLENMASWMIKSRYPKLKKDMSRILVNNEKKNNELIVAAINNRSDKVEEMLKTGEVDISSLTDDNKSLLFDYLLESNLVHLIKEYKYDFGFGDSKGKKRSRKKL